MITPINSRRSTIARRHVVFACATAFVMALSSAASIAAADNSDSLVGNLSITGLYSTDKSNGPRAIGPSYYFTSNSISACILRLTHNTPEFSALKGSLSPQEKAGTFSFLFNSRHAGSFFGLQPCNTQSGHWSGSTYVMTIPDSARRVFLRSRFYVLNRNSSQKTIDSVRPDLVPRSLSVARLPVLQVHFEDASGAPIVGPDDGGSGAPGMRFNLAHMADVLMLFVPPNAARLVFEESQTNGGIQSSVSLGFGPDMSNPANLAASVNITPDPEHPDQTYIYDVYNKYIPYTPDADALKQLLARPGWDYLAYSVPKPPLLGAFSIAFGK